MIIVTCPEVQLDKLQSVQNAAARLVRCQQKSEHITPILYNLHWLGIRERIVFKVLLTVYKMLDNSAPSYLCDLVDRYIPGRGGLRSSKGLLKRQDSINIPQKHMVDAELSKHNIVEYPATHTVISRGWQHVAQ